MDKEEAIPEIEAQKSVGALSVGLNALRSRVMSETDREPDQPELTGVAEPREDLTLCLI